MTRYVVGRVFQATVIVGGITLAVFVILRITGGDPARIRAPIFARPDVVDQYRKEFGTDRPLLVQLADFLTGVLHGNLGTSFRFEAPVTQLILERLPYTLALAGVALLFAVTMAIVLGVLSARHPGSPVDAASSLLAAVGQAAPIFWTGLVLIQFAAVGIGLLPPGGYTGPESLILPGLSVALAILPTELRVLRASMQSVLRQDYIRTARAFGLPEWRINFVYALRNACLPMLTVVGVDMGYLLGGVIVAEVVFDFPGVGQLALIALNSRDYPLIQGITIVTAATFVLINLLVDLLYVIVDPRIRLGD